MAAPLADYQYDAFRTGGHLNGILRHLREESGGDLHANGEIEIDSAIEGVGDPSNVVNPEEKEGWSSVSGPDAWIRFNFKNRGVRLNQYMLQVVSPRAYPCEWDIEGSTDGDKWKLLDRRNIRASGELRWGWSVFGCTGESASEFVRLIRLHQTGVNSNGGDSLDLDNIEFFGTLQGDGGPEWEAACEIERSHGPFS
jgi:hypothetical protein